MPNANNNGGQTPHESVLNVRLSDLLRKKGLPSSAPEKAAGRKRHDIHIAFGVMNAVIEAEKGTTPPVRKRAVMEAESRVGKTADIAIALCYPEGITERNMARQKFLWAVRSPQKLAKPPKWEEGDLDGLANVILSLPNEIGGTDGLAARLSGALSVAVFRLDKATKTMLAEHLDLPIAGASGLNNAAMRSLLVIATAIMFHIRLGAHLGKANKPDIDQRRKPPVPYTGEWPPKSARECAESDKPIAAYNRAWNIILAVDYRPVFETALKALTNASPALSAAVAVIAETVLDITEEAASLRHDLVGRIFHRILDTARYDGSYYTSTTAASMLAALAVREDDADWQKPESIGKLRIVDPACGTGTLLMAAAERMRDLANRAGGGGERLEKMFIENILHGYDTNLTATHLAATTLGLLSPGTEFSKMNIERTFLGVDEEAGRASLGSLEFMPDGQPTLLGWVGGQQHVDETNRRIREVGMFDLVIMNPPFTRDSLRHQQFSRDEAQALRNREKILFHRHLKNNNGKTLHMSSQGNNFVVLADRLASAKGALAAILPMVTATNPSSRGIRRFLADKFDIELIVAPHDPQRVCFSENTGISELLLVCRRRKKGAKCAPARVIALSENPDSPAHAMMTARAISEGKTRDNFVVHKINGEQLIAGDWSAVQFLSPRLFRLFEQLRGGNWFNAGHLTNLGTMLNGRGVRGYFVKRQHAPPEGMIALWDHKTDVITKMATSHDTYISPKKGMEERASAIWQQRGRLMLPARLGLPVTRALAVIVSRPAVGSGWYAFNCPPDMKDAQKKMREKALCLYINSSVGILAMLGVRDFKILGYPNFSKESIGKLPVPEFKDAKQLAKIAAAYDEYAESELMPLRLMAKCPVRQSIDYAVADAFGISREQTDELRELLPREPCISGKRHQPITLTANDKR